MNVIVCDDDEIILEGLAKCIPWEDLGVRLVGTAENGRKAERLLRENKVDLVITDVKMPYVTGLDLIRKAREANPDLIAVMISGYSDFEYARRALKLGALDYISKPLDVDELIGAVRKAEEYYRKMREERDGRVERAAARLADASRKEEAGDRELLEERYRGCFGQVVIVELDEFYLTMRGGDESGENRAIREYERLIADCRAEKMVVAGRLGYSTVLAVIRRSEAELALAVDRLHRRVEAYNGNAEFEVRVTLAVGGVCKAVGLLGRSREEADITLKYKFIKGIGACISYDDVKGYEEEEKAVTGAGRIELPSPLRIKDEEEIGRIVEETADKLRRENRNRETLSRITMGHWYLSVSRELAEYNMDLKEIFDDPAAEFDKLYLCGDFQEMMDSFEDIYRRIFRFVQRYKQGKYTVVIARATRYMKDNYMKPGLCIEEVAEYVRMSVGYFSLIFHSETGRTFTDYLTGIRIDRARELMENSELKLYEVAGRVGYDNATYFSTLFKKVVGVTPSEYRVRKR